MAITNFRNDARGALDRAKAELASGQEHRLRYAALELRLAIEALTYERARAYKDDIAPEEYATWQPRKLMQLMLDINSDADQGSTLHIGEEDPPGTPSTRMQYFGVEAVLGLPTIKLHYDALGAFLHAPTIKQAENGGHDFSKLKARCDALVDAIDKVLQSTVWNINFGHFSTCECVECGKKMHRRIPSNKEFNVVKCFECHTPYRITNQSSGTVHWQPMQMEIGCPTAGCDGKMILYQSDFRRGACWTCKSCNTPYIVDLGIRRDDVPPPLPVDREPIAAK